jgi:hypothetical protein
MSELWEITLPRLVEGGAFGGRHHEIMVFNFCAVCVFVATTTRFRTFMLVYIQNSEYVLYACMRTPLASPAEAGNTIIIERLCISRTEAICQGDKPYMQQCW